MTKDKRPENLTLKKFFRFSSSDVPMMPAAKDDQKYHESHHDSYKEDLRGKTALILLPALITAEKNEKGPASSST